MKFLLWGNASAFQLSAPFLFLSLVRKIWTSFPDSLKSIGISVQSFCVLITFLFLPCFSLGIHCWVRIFLPFLLSLPGRCLNSDVVATMKEWIQGFAFVFCSSEFGEGVHIYLKEFVCLLVFVFIFLLFFLNWGIVVKSSLVCTLRKTFLSSTL